MTDVTSVRELLEQTMTAVDAVAATLDTPVDKRRIEWVRDEVRYALAGLDYFDKGYKA